MSKAIIIDTDPGIDDALALALAAASSEVNILGITAVAGNVGVEQTSANAAWLADLLRLDIPIGKGACGPIWQPDVQSAAHVHGDDGLGGFRKERSARSFEPALQLMVRLISSSLEPVTLVGIGPLTNLATLIAHYPEVAQKVERFVVMGGGTGFNTGNVTAAAEFNIHYDPAAAAAVFNSGIPTTMVGLNVTEKALVSWDHLPLLAVGTGPVSALVRHLLGAYRSRATDEGMAQHDSLALAAVIAPDLVTSKKLHVDVETRGRLTAGMTVVDWRGNSASTPNCDVAVSLDVEGFRKLLDERLSALDQTLAGQIPTQLG